MTVTFGALRRRSFAKSPAALAGRTRWLTSDRLVRIVQFALAVYLLPALVVVVVVSGVWMLVLSGLALGQRNDREIRRELSCW